MKQELVICKVDGEPCSKERVCHFCNKPSKYSQLPIIRKDGKGEIIEVEGKAACVTFGMNMAKGYCAIHCPKRFNNSAACHACCEEIKTWMGCRGGLLTTDRTLKAENAPGGYLIK